MTTESKYSVQAENKRIADALRRLADGVEQSTHAHCWHLQVNAGEPVSVSMASLDSPDTSLAFGAMRAMVAIGDAEFVSNLKDHLDAEK